MGSHGAAVGSLTREHTRTEGTGTDLKVRVFRRNGEVMCNPYIFGTAASEGKERLVEMTSRRTLSVYSAGYRCLKVEVHLLSHVTIQNQHKVAPI